MTYVAGSRIWLCEFATARVEAQAPMAKLPVHVHQGPIDLSQPGQGNKKFNPFDGATVYVRVVSEVPATISIDPNVNAQASSLVVVPMVPEYFGVIPGAVMTVSPL